MDARALKTMLKAGGPVFGTWSHLPYPTVVEIIGAAGLDFVVFDLEHGPHGWSDLPALCCAAERRGMTPVIRVPGTENSAILRSLDTGARGIMVPHVDSADEARMILDSLRYGDSARNRGVATLTRASMFDTRHEREHLASQSELITSIVMIETRDGLEALDEICALPGLDVVFVGIYDLSQSLGMLGGLDHPEFQRLFAETVQRITAHGVAVGCYAATAEAAKRLLDQGVRFVTLCVDGGVLRRAYEGMLDDLGRLTGEAR